MNVTCPHCGEQFSLNEVQTVLGAARAEKNLSLRAVGEMVGVSIREMSRIERGISAQPRLDIARKIAAVYGSTIDQLWPFVEETASTEVTETEDDEDDVKSEFE